MNDKVLAPFMDYEHREGTVAKVDMENGTCDVSFSELDSKHRGKSALTEHDISLERVYPSQPMDVSVCVQALDRKRLIAACTRAQVDTACAPRVRSARSRATNTWSISSWPSRKIQVRSRLFLAPHNWDVFAASSRFG